MKRIKIVGLRLNSNMRHIAVIGLINFILSFILCGVVYLTERRNICDDYGNQAYAIAGIVASTLDVEKIIKYKNSLEMDDDYNEIVKKLDLIKSRSGLKFLYVESWDQERNRFTIYYATEPGDGIKDSAYNRELLGTRVESNEHFSKLVSDSENLEKWHEDNNSYGHTICAYYPILDSDGNNIALVGADFELYDILNLGKKIINLLIATQISIIIATAVIILAIDRFVSSPLREISKLAKHFVNSDHNKINVVPINLKTKLAKDSDIKLLADSLSKMMLDVKKYSENIRKITAEKEKVSAELNIATKIQKSLIPHIFPAFPELKEIDIYATMDPAQKIGGDFYDFFLMDKDKLAFIIADVSGKGIAAALFMVIAKTLIKNQAVSCSNPKTIIENVNKQMCVGNSLGMFITAFFGILDLKTGEIQYVNAGHVNPIARLEGNNFKELKLDKQFVIAGMPSVKFKLNKIKLSPGDILFMYTDGISEALSKDNSYFGKDNLISVLSSIDPKANLKQISDFVKSKIKEFTNGAEQSDDITMLVIKYNGTIK